MGSQLSGEYELELVIPFAPAAKNRLCPIAPINSTMRGTPS